MPPPPLQTGSPTTSALETVVASDERITLIQREIELLEADAEGGASAAPTEAGAMVAGSKSSAHPRPPAPPSAAAGGGGAPSLAMSELQREIAELSLEDQASRLAEAYEDLDVLVRVGLLSRGKSFSNATFT